MFRTFLAVAFLLLPDLAHADDWYEARSANFIVIGQGGEKEVRARAEELERFGLVVQAMTGARRLKDPAVRVRVYFLDGVGAVQRTMTVPSEGVVGYYSPDVRGPIAVMPRATGKGKPAQAARRVLQHELTHHFMFQYFPTAYPAWYKEGFAEYVGVMEVDADNVASVGLPLEGRIREIQYLGWTPIRKVLTARNYGDLGGNVLALYNEGWLLVHYLNADPARKAQLDRYLHAIHSGQSFEKATEALGDLDDLDRRLRVYSKSYSLRGTATRYEKLDIGPIAMRPLSSAETALVTADIRLTSGVLKDDKPQFVDGVRAIAARYPNDAYALRILAEAERDARNYDRAAAAVARWLAVAPKDPLALMHRGELALLALKKTKSSDAAAWTAARADILAANRIAPRDPRILKAYYDSFVSEGVLPPASAQNALMNALDAVPQDDSLRVEVARDFEKREMYDDAIAVIRPVALELRDESEMSPKQRARLAEAKKKLAEAAESDEPIETPREILSRLEKRRAEKKGEKPAQPSAPAS